MNVLGSEDTLAELRWLLRGGKIGAVRSLVRNVGTLIELIDDSSAVPWRTTAALVLAIGYVASPAERKPPSAN
jgi:hypothetical protein